MSFADGTSPNHQIRLTGKEKASVTDGRASKLIAWRLFIPTTSLIDDEMLLIRCRHSDFIYSVYQQRDKSEGKHTLGRKKNQPSLSLNAYALTHGRLDGLPIQLLRRLAPRIKIKAVSNVPVGRLAALWKQAFMCSGWQAFDVSSRVWD